LPFLLYLGYRRERKAILWALGTFVGANLGLLLLSGFVKTGKSHLVTIYRRARRAALSMRSTRAPNSTRTRSSTSTPSLPPDGVSAWASNLARQSHHTAGDFRPAAAPTSTTKEESPFANPLDSALLMMASLTLFYHRVYDLAAIVFVLYGLID